MRSLLASLLLFLLAPALPAPVPAADGEAPFVLGVLRRDGVVLPFASFKGKDWQSRWPGDIRSMELPLLLGDVPPGWWGRAAAPGPMTIWRDGAARGTITLDRPVIVTPACERRIGITSNYKAGELPPPPIVRPYPKDGLVSSGPQPIDAIEAVQPGTRDMMGAALVLLDPMDKAEQEAIDQFTDWKHPLPRQERRKIPIEIEALYRVPMDEVGWFAYHVEAVKRYAPEPTDEGCGLITSASGWIALGPKGKMWTQISARVTYCDRKGVAYFLPLGLMHMGGRTYWIFQTSGYDLEWYSIARPTSKGILVEAGYTAGRCGGF
jgi:hypothetical protein